MKSYFGIICELLHVSNADFDIIKEAKGKYKLPTTWKEVWNKIKGL